MGENTCLLGGGGGGGGAHTSGLDFNNGSG